MTAADESVFQTPATYRALANSLPLSLLIKTTDGRRVFANENYLKWRRLDWKSVVGKTDAELFPVGVARKYIEDDRRVLSTGEALHSVERSELADGQMGWIERIKSPIRDHRGNLLGIQVMFWDVTRRIEAERAMRYEQSLLTTLLENIPDSIYFKDLDSRFMRVSRAMAEKFGLRGVDQVHGRTDADIFTPEHAQDARRDELEIIRSGRPLVGRVERETWPDRQDTWCLTTKMPLRDGSGDVIGTFGLSRDVTDLKRTEAALREAVRTADAANRAKSEFLANMSHEIRTPMNAIVGMADLLSQTRLDSEQQESVNVIRESSDALLRLINDILDFSKIEARRLELESIPFCLAKVVQSAMMTVRWQASEKGLDLVTEIDPTLPERYQGDPGRLRQVLVNLVGNAIKFTDQGSVTVRIWRRKAGDEIAADADSAKPRRLNDATGHQDHAARRSPSRGGTPLLIQVRDTGIGIPESKQGSVLDPFTQADASTTRRFGGTGLGLSISRQLVELMGGSLKVASQVGVGTTFSFDLQLPATDQPSTTDDHWELNEEDIAASGDQPATPGGRQDREKWSQLASQRLRILVAEDGVTNQHVITGLLRSLGHQCAVASDGREAVARWKAEKYDVILMDMHMPVMDGLEATQAIRQHELGTDRHTPIIALTAAAMSEDAAACRQAGMDDYVTKPIHRRRLQRLLATLAPATDSGPDEEGSSGFEKTLPPPCDQLPPKETPAAKSSGRPSAADLDGYLDLDAARSRIPGGEKGVRRLATVFRSECLQLVDHLQQHLQAGDGDAARRAAHTLKGACGLLGATRLQEVARQIEQAGHDGSILPIVNDQTTASLARDLSQCLQLESDQVIQAIEAWLDASDDPPE